jgi:hypothetical protein
MSQIPRPIMGMYIAAGEFKKRIITYAKERGVDCY